MGGAPTETNVVVPRIPTGSWLRRGLKGGPQKVMPGAPLVEFCRHWSAGLPNLVERARAIRAIRRCIVCPVATWSRSTGTCGGGFSVMQLAVEQMMPQHPDSASADGCLLLAAGCLLTAAC